MRLDQVPAKGKPLKVLIKETDSTNVTVQGEVVRVERTANRITISFEYDGEHYTRRPIYIPDKRRFVGVAVPVF